jgi:hypothetical protein
MTDKFTDVISDLAASLQVTSAHIATQRVQDAVVAGTLHRVGVITREAGRQLADVIAGMSPAMRAKIDALVLKSDGV